MDKDAAVFAANLKTHFHWWVSPLQRLPSASLNVNACPAPALDSVTATLDTLLAENENLHKDNKAPLDDPPRRRPPVANISTRAILGTGSATPGSASTDKGHHRSREEGRSSPGMRKALPSRPSILDHILLVLKKKPIIIVPSRSGSDLSPTSQDRSSTLCIDNAQEFLEKGKLILDPKVLRDLSVTREVHKFVIQKQIGERRSPIRFTVVDASITHRFGKEDWEAVVAVFVTGAEWQFRTWPWTTPDEVFLRVKAYFCALKDKPAPKLSQHPQCNTLVFSQVLRHSDCEVHRLFWDSFTDFLRRPADTRPG